MVPQTLTIGEAETQLRSLLNEVRTSQQSVVVTNDDAIEPMALLMPIWTDTRDRRQTVVRHIELLESVIGLWQEDIDASVHGHAYAHLFHAQLRVLSEVIPDELSILASAVMLLRLALRTLNEKTTITELTAIQQVVARLKPLDLTPAALTAIDQLLLDAGIDAQADLGDSDLLQAYVDVL